MGQHLAETTRILRWKYANLVFALLAILSAGGAMALPGPAGDVTGFSAVLFVGALALLAGHHWGILVIAAAEVMILGKTWPLVMDAFTSVPLSGLSVAAALTTTLCALPGLVLFAVTLPYSIEVVIGEKDSRAQRPFEILSLGAAAFWVLSPLAPLF